MPKFRVGDRVAVSWKDDLSAARQLDGKKATVIKEAGADGWGSRAKIHLDPGHRWGNSDIYLRESNLVLVQRELAVGDKVRISWDTTDPDVSENLNGATATIVTLNPWEVTTADPPALLHLDEGTHGWSRSRVYMPLSYLKPVSAEYVTRLRLAAAWLREEHDGTPRVLAVDLLSYLDGQRVHNCGAICERGDGTLC